MGKKADGKQIFSLFQTVYQKALVVKKDVLGEHRAYFDLGPSKNDEIVTITATEYSKFVVNGKNAAWFLLFNALSPAFQCRLCGYYYGRSDHS